MITLNLSSYAYTGGLHGYGASIFYHIDLKDEKIVSDTILFGQDNLGKIEKLIQAEIIRRNEDENSEESITLLVEVEDIKTNDNFSLQKKVLFIHTINTR